MSQVDNILLYYKLSRQIEKNSNIIQNSKADDKIAYAQEQNIKLTQVQRLVKKKLDVYDYDVEAEVVECPNCGKEGMAVFDKVTNIAYVECFNCWKESTNEKEQQELFGD